MLTKLDAVNKCLRAIGEERLNSLDSGVPDASAAEAIIDEVTTEVLSLGWSDNTEQGVTLNPGPNKKIVVSDKTLKVTGQRQDYYRRLTIRRPQVEGPHYLFDLATNTDTFKRPITVNVVRHFEFESLPNEFKNYIANRSARIFQETSMGSQALDVFTARQEAEAWARLLDHEAETSGLNALHDSPTMAHMTYRNQPIGWR